MTEAGLANNCRQSPGYSPTVGLTFSKQQASCMHSSLPKMQLDGTVLPSFACHASSCSLSHFCLAHPNGTEDQTGLQRSNNSNSPCAQEAAFGKIQSNKRVDLIYHCDTRKLRCHARSGTTFQVHECCVARASVGARSGLCLRFLWCMD